MAGAIDLRKGTVTWFDVRRGFGFITPEDGGENLFVHKSAIKTVGYLSLSLGEAVEFVVSVGDDGRRKAVRVTGPGGAYIKGRRHFCGTCFRCGEVGHMAMDCKSNGACTRLGPCYRCGVMGHLARECPNTRIETSSPRPNLLIPSNLGSFSSLSPQMAVPSDSGKECIRTLLDQLSEIRDSEEEEEEIHDEDREFPSGGEERNWAELTCDVLSVIFKKITAVDIIRSAQFVCRPWRQLSHEPELWRHIEVTMPDERMEMTDLESLAMLAVDRSEGCLEEFHLECFGSENDELIGYISDRAPKLRCLRLISIYSMSEMPLAEAVGKLPLLEEFEISFCYFSAELVELVGLACPQLKSFKLNAQPYRDQYDYDIDSDVNFDAEALSIAMHMQQLHRLQLIGNNLTNIGLLAILNNCPNLQYLDLRGCLNVNLDENMKKKCAKIKDLRLPKDSTADYEYHQLIVGIEACDADFNHTLSDSEYDFDYGDCGFYDSDMFFDDFFEFC